MTKTAKWSMIGVVAALLLALFAVAGCSSDNAANTDNYDNNSDIANPSVENSKNGTGTDNSGSQMGDGGSIGEGTVLKVPNGWAAYSQGDMLVLLDSDQDVQYQWTAEVDGNTVLKDTDADLPSSNSHDQTANDVVGSAGMHAFGVLADDQNNGDSTITMKLANTTNADDVKTTIVVKATVQDGAFTAVSIQE